MPPNPIVEAPTISVYRVNYEMTQPDPRGFCIIVSIIHLCFMAESGMNLVSRLVCDTQPGVLDKRELCQC